jgi:UDP-N-acetylmuramyl pentapeptide phosphotransferase/UDP-N-acetylglucosamine-1-phosphate transferase
VSHIIPILLAFAVAAWLSRRFSSPDSFFHVLDHPGERSLHQQATPRSGGVAIVVALLLSWGMAALTGGIVWSSVLSWLVAGVLLLAVVGGMDDRWDLSARVRLLIQLLAALCLIGAELLPQRLLLPGFGIGLPEMIGIPFMLLFVLWMTNLYNFMDGMDGFAGGMAVIGFASLGMLGWWGGDSVYMLVAATIAAACAGFLISNFPPAKIFMGDAGSPVLGFLAAGLSLWADRENLFPLWVAVLIFSPFIVDASLTLLRRLLAGEKIWQAHRKHYYQRLVQTGWSHRRTVLWAYGLMLIVGAAALMALNQKSVVQWGIIVFCGLLYAGVISAVKRKERPEA